MKKFFSSDIFKFVATGVIIFLTACAQRGYYTRTEPLVSQTPMVGESNFVWPLKSRVAGPSGKGIVIESSEGEAVQASMSGRVSFVDEKFKGYGRTVVLEHHDQFSTVYAGNSEILVELGQWVRQGEVIAKTGHTGRIANPGLYFELRKNAQAQDPLKYLL